MSSTADSYEPPIWGPAASAISRDEAFIALRELVGDTSGMGLESLVVGERIKGPDDLVALFRTQEGRILKEIAEMWRSSERPDHVRLVELLIHLMVWDEPLIDRRHLVNMFSAVARRDVELVTDRLDSAKWFVSRNMLIALARARDASACEAVRQQLGHADDRVRVEALRCLMALDAEASLSDVSAAIADSSRRVRDAAFTLLRAQPSTAVVDELKRVITHKRLRPETAARAVGIIAERRGPEAQAALRDLAAVRSLNPTRRAARSEARRLLEEAA
jgi:HEAT repeat protein